MPFLFRGCLKITYFTQFKVLSEEFNPQNTMSIPPVKFFFRLELEQTKQFSNSLLEAFVKTPSWAQILRYDSVRFLPTLLAKQSLPNRWELASHYGAKANHPTPL